MNDDVFKQLETAHQEVLKLAGGGHAASLISDVKQGLNAAPKSGGNRLILLVWLLVFVLAIILEGVVIVGLNNRLIDSEIQVVEAKKIQTSYSVDLKEQYYRGLYDSCTSFLTNVAGIDHKTAIVECLAIARRVAVDGWYEQASDGFDYP